LRRWPTHTWRHRNDVSQLQVLHRKVDNRGILLDEEVVFGEAFDVQHHVCWQLGQLETPPASFYVVAGVLVVKLFQQIKDGYLNMQFTVTWRAQHQQLSTLDARKALAAVRIRFQTAHSVNIQKRKIWWLVACDENAALHLNVMPGNLASRILSSDTTADLDAVNITSLEHRVMSYTVYRIARW